MARPPGQVVEQRRFTHARLAVHDQCPALSRLDRLDQPVKHIALGTAVGQPCRAPPHRACGHRHGTNGIPRPRPAHLAAKTSHWRMRSRPGRRNL
jgi:hypothetical protein